jgi:hypothetical protein
LMVRPVASTAHPRLRRFRRTCYPLAEFDWPQKFAVLNPLPNCRSIEEEEAPAFVLLLVASSA